MKDAYSFDADEKGLEENYQKMLRAYFKIFDRCQLKYVVIEAESGFMGGDVSHEFMAPADCGEDKVIICKKCKYAAGLKENKPASCPKCKGEIEVKSAIELGHVFKLGTKYSSSLGATFLDKDGATRPCVMGCYGIGINRIIAASIEQNNDKDGIIWPASIAPYQALIIEVNSDDKETRKTGEELYNSLIENKLEVLLDDRPERAGIKFKDADLIGIPVQIIIGEKNLKDKKAEIKIRRTGERIAAKITEIPAKVRKILS